MPEREQNQAALDAMCEEYLSEVDNDRRFGGKPALPEGAKAIFRNLLNDPSGAHENLLQAIDEGNLQTMMVGVGGGQGMYSAPSKALCIQPDALEQAAANPAIAYNLNFTLAHECRHARDGGEIVQSMETLRQDIFAKAQDHTLPHDYTQIVRDYLDRDRVFEQHAETEGLNAHVSKVIADKGGHATLRDVYESSPKDMAPYIDVTPSQSVFGQPGYAYKPGFVVAGDGLHVDAAHPSTLAAIGTHFYDDQNYDWKQGLKATLDVINSAEQDAIAVTDPRLPPRIDVAALGVGPPPDTLCRGMMQHVVDSSLPAPNAHGSPDREYFALLQGKLPEASDDVVAHALLAAKHEGLTDPSRVNLGETGIAENGKIWIAGTRGERVEVDPTLAPPIAMTTQRLETHAFEQAQLRAEPVQQQKSGCLMM